MTKIRYDTTGTRYTCFLHEYQAAILHNFLHEGRLYTASSRDVYTWLNKPETIHTYGLKTKRDKAASRASVINTLNRFVEEDILTFTEKTGKGGHRRIYRLSMEPKNVDVHLVGEVMASLRDNFPLAYESAKGLIKTSE